MLGSTVSRALRGASRSKVRAAKSKRQGSHSVTPAPVCTDSLQQLSPGLEGEAVDYRTGCSTKPLHLIICFHSFFRVGLLAVGRGGVAVRREPWWIRGVHLRGTDVVLLLLRLAAVVERGPAVVRRRAGAASGVPATCACTWAGTPSRPSQGCGGKGGTRKGALIVFGGCGPARPRQQARQPRRDVTTNRCRTDACFLSFIPLLSVEIDKVQHQSNISKIFKNLPWWTRRTPVSP